MTSSLRQTVVGLPLFVGLEQAEFDRLFDLLETRQFPAGAQLFGEGQMADALWVVLTGDVEVSREGRVLAELGPGAALGEVSLFTHHARRSATVKAICPVEVARLPTTPFRKLLEANDVGALKLVSHLAHQMAERLVALNERLLSQGKRGLSVARSELRRVVL